MADDRKILDALVAEMLGDIGKLHDAVDSLSETLPAQTEAAEKRLFALVALLNSAGEAYKSQIEAYTNAQGEKIRAQMESDAAVIKTRLTDDASKAIKAVLSDFELNVLLSMQKSRWLNFFGCLACGILGGLLVWVSVAFTQYVQNQRYIALGRATAATWDRLDGKARAVINAELGRPVGQFEAAPKPLADNLKGQRE